MFITQNNTEYSFLNDVTTAANETIDIVSNLLSTDLNYFILDHVISIDDITKTIQDYMYQAASGAIGEYDDIKSDKIDIVFKVADISGVSKEDTFTILERLEDKTLTGDIKNVQWLRPKSKNPNPVISLNPVNQQNPPNSSSMTLLEWALMIGVGAFALYMIAGGPKRK